MVDACSLMEQAISNNPNIPEVNGKGDAVDVFAIKARLYGIMKPVIEAYPNLPWAEICPRFETLKIVYTSNISMPDFLTQYLPQVNTIKINGKKLAQDPEEYDLDFHLLTEFLKVITVKGYDYGFAQGGQAEALDQGYREMMATNLIGNAGEDGLTDEMVTTNLLGVTIGADALNQAFFSNNFGVIIHAWLEQGMPADELSELCALTNYNYHARTHIGESQLGQIQNKLTASFFQSQNSQYPSCVQAYKLNAVGRNEEMGDRHHYTDLNTVYPTILMCVAQKKNQPDELMSESHIR